MVVEVGPKSEWKDKEHPFRKDPALLLTSVPTMMRWQDGAFTHRLDADLESAHTPDAAEALLQTFVEGSQ